MTQPLHSPALQHPEKIHPSLWRGSQLAHFGQETIPSGYCALDAQLPGHGWPTGTLIEIMSARSGIGEVQLLKPALLSLPSDRNIVLINPPYIPSALCLMHWFSDTQRIYWIRSSTTRNTLWAAEKVLLHNSSAALLCWFNNAHPASVRRLHLAAHGCLQKRTTTFEYFDG